METKEPTKTKLPPSASENVQWEMEAEMRLLRGSWLGIEPGHGNSSRFKDALLLTSQHLQFRPACDVEYVLGFVNHDAVDEHKGTVT
ncbi:hypothetical protein L6164_031815 [Bauhinia variegata]|uniref:Uncharacterized protein n=1 Tax=Bauhinia variegata TaxID=167791 RepID=A0ACB9KLY0_BAUVA|nr:hypothetical protein L6164_031815 [Bauhinia variegata]